MSEKLNDEYFKTREKHKKESAGKMKYVFFIIVCIATYFVFNFFTSKTKVDDTQLREERIKQHEVLISENLLFEDSVITVQQGDYRIKILKGYSYTFLNEDGPLIIASTDSSGANIILHFLEDNIHIEDYAKNLSYNLIGEILKKEYKEGGYMEKSEVTFTKNQTDFFGAIYLFKKGDVCLVIQGTSNVEFWESKNVEVYDMIDSFFTLNKKKSS
jgi:hypothetical protein